MSSIVNSHQSVDAEDKFENLLAMNEYDLATIWGREIIRKATNVTYDVRPSCIAVKTGNFTGTHDYAVEEGEVVVSEHGAFQYRGEQQTFRFKVFTLNQVVKAEIYSNEVMRGDSSEPVERKRFILASDWFFQVITTIQSKLAMIRRYVLGR